MNRVRISLITLLLAASGAAYGGQAEQSTDRAELEKRFSERMSNVVMTGHFTVEGKETDQPLKPETYEIESVTKAQGDYWIFLVRIKYGDKDVKLPITLKVLWAGDTPMVTLTNLTIPGLGEGFTSRVLFHEDRYAGTWQHGKVGGHLFGTISEPGAAEKARERE